MSHINSYKNVCLYFLKQKKKVYPDLIIKITKRNKGTPSVHCVGNPKRRFWLVITSDTDWIGNILQKDKTKAQMASPKHLSKGKVSKMALLLFLRKS